MIKKNNHWNHCFDRLSTVRGFSRLLPLLCVTAILVLVLAPLAASSTLPVRLDGVEETGIKEIKKEQVQEETGKQEPAEEKKETEPATPGEAEKNQEEPADNQEIQGIAALGKEFTALLQSLDDTTRKQLDNLLMAAAQVEKLDAWKGPGQGRRIFKQRAGRYLAKAAALSADPLQKQYLEALAQDINSGNYKTSAAYWLEQNVPPVDMIIYYKRIRPAAAKAPAAPGTSSNPANPTTTAATAATAQPVTGNSEHTTQAGARPIDTTVSQPRQNTLKTPGRRLEIYVLVNHKESTEKAKKYSAVLDKMMDNIPLRDKMTKLDPSYISPILVADAVYRYPVNAGRHTLVLPVTLPGIGTGTGTGAGADTGKAAGTGTGTGTGTSTDTSTDMGTAAIVNPGKFKIIVFRNILETYFKDSVAPLAERILAPRWAKAVDFDAYLSNLLMHRLAHYIGPVFLNRQDERAIPVKTELKEFFLPIEEIMADTAAIVNTQVLIDEKFISKEQEQNIYAAYLLSLLKKVSLDARDPLAKTALIQLNQLLKNDAVTLDISQSKITLAAAAFAQSAKRLLALVVQVESAGDYNGAKSLLSGNLTGESEELQEILKILKKPDEQKKTKTSKKEKPKKKKTTGQAAE